MLVVEVVGEYKVKRKRRKKVMIGEGVSDKEILVVVDVVIVGVDM